MGKEAVTLDRALGLMRRLAAGPHPASLAEAADALALPPSTARRIAGVLSRHGLLQRVARGRYMAGPDLVRLAVGREAHRVLAETARPIGRRLARRLKATVHLGVFEADMITYVLKAPDGSREVLTREGDQLEAYCTAIGKMLLACLPEPDRERYLATGPFVPLTGATVTEPEQLRRRLIEAAEAGFATDQGEMLETLSCVAVPVRNRSGAVVAALSASWLGTPGDHSRALPALREAAAAIGRSLGEPPPVA